MLTSRLLHAAAAMGTLCRTVMVTGAGRAGAPRFLNHSCAPSVGAGWGLMEGAGGAGRAELLLFSLRAITPGEALTVDYAADPVLFRGQARRPRPPPPSFPACASARAHPIAF